MVRKLLRVNGKAQVLTMHQELIDDGYDGDVPAYVGVNTVILVKPGTTLENILASLQISISEIQLTERKVNTKK